MDSIEQLFAEVYANPGDDHVRRVLADALLAIGDPRGELIACQLSPDVGHRAMRLIQAYGLTWLGPLRGAVIPLAYERGFLASAALLESRALDLDNPLWSTVHTIDLEDFDDVTIAEFRVTPAMRSLTTLIGLSETQDLILRKRQPDVLDRLTIVLVPAPDGPLDETYDPIAE